MERMGQSSVGKIPLMGIKHGNVISLCNLLVVLLRKEQVAIAAPMSIEKAKLGLPTVCFGVNEKLVLKSNILSYAIVAFWTKT